MWKIEYSKEVRNYLYDSYPYTETIWQTMKALRHQADGLPSMIVMKKITDLSPILRAGINHPPSTSYPQDFQG